MNKSSQRFLKREDLKKSNKICLCRGLQKRQYREFIIHPSKKVKQDKSSKLLRTVKVVQEKQRLLDNPKETWLSIQWKREKRLKILTKGSWTNKILQEIWHQPKPKNTMRISLQSLLRLSTICTVMLIQSEMRLIDLFSLRIPNLDHQLQ